jgi:hypothetical protein
LKEWLVLGPFQRMSEDIFSVSMMDLIEDLIQKLVS